MLGEQLKEFLHTYRKLGATEAAVLEELTRQYPWFNAAHILLAKAHKNQNRYSFRNLLKKASLHAGDRSELFDFMHDRWRIPGTEIKSTVSIPEINPPEISDEQAILEAEIPETSNAVASDEVGVSETALPAEALTAGVEWPDPVEPEEHEPFPEGPTEESQPEQDTFLPVVTDNSQIEEEVQESEKLPEDRFTGEEPDPGAEKLTVDTDGGDLETGFERESDAFSGSNGTWEGSELPDEPPVVPVDEARSLLEKAIQYDPISALRTLVTDESPTDLNEHAQKDKQEHPLIKPIYDPEKELLKYISEDISEERSPEKLAEDGDEHGFSFWLDHLEESDADPDAQKNEENSAKTELLDRFILHQPSIRKLEREFFTPEKQSQRSVEDNSDIVSESLARLYLKQGFIEKAIDVFAKLRLQNPEKDAYFAGLIEEIKQNHSKS